MKLRVGDQVLVTGGKDKGKRSKIVRVLPKKDTVVVEGVNMYVKHLKPQGERSGEKIRKERPLPTAKVAILNEKGQPDRIGYRLLANGDKERIFKKTGTAVGQAAATPAKVKEVKAKPAEKAAKASAKSNKSKQK